MFALLDLHSVYIRCGIDFYFINLDGGRFMKSASMLTSFHKVYELVLKSYFSTVLHSHMSSIQKVLLPLLSEKVLCHFEKGFYVAKAGLQVDKELEI